MTLITPNFPFRWAQKYITYLGTEIPTDLAKTFSLNFPPLLTSIHSDRQKWAKGKLSWMGRCNAAKMSTFPRLLYLFQTLPIKIPSRYLRDVNKTFAEFVWNH